jgi:phosphoribosyl-ATP pyrophosphohydrolase
MLKDMSDSLHRLFDAITGMRGKDTLATRTGRLLRAGKRKIAKKVAEEAAEVAIDAATGRREEVIRESADLLYHLAVLWADARIHPKEIWAEMDRREKLMGIAEKLPKNGLPESVQNKVTVPLDRARRKRAR